MSAEQFFDTNVVLYLLSGDRAKADRAETLLAKGGTISVQVLNEFAAVAPGNTHFPGHTPMMQQYLRQTAFLGFTFSNSAP